MINYAMEDMMSLHDDELDTQGAILYLSERLKMSVKPDAFYHRVKRGSIPYTTIEHGKSQRYRFRREDLDKVRFRSHTRRKAPKSFELIEVHSDVELAALRHKFGRLLDLRGFLAELKEYTGHTYTAGMVKQRRRRGTVLYVGYSGSPNRPQYWYPANQIPELNLQPREKR